MEETKETSKGNQLPRIAILATGGTIAGAAGDPTQVTGYKAGSLGINALIDAVPAIRKIAEVTGEQVSAISSNNLTDELLLKISRRCSELLSDPTIDGIVITHGTDTLEETAYFLNLTVHSDTPIVLVGAMRPATAISADGPLNLLNAVKVATDSHARGKGTLVVMADLILSARDATKTSGNFVSAFQSPVFGTLGVIVAGTPGFYRISTRRHTKQSEFDISGIKALPRVDIVYSHTSADRVMIDAAVAAGARGIVIAGTGNGSLHDDEEAGALDAMKKGVVFVRASHTGSGVVTDSVPRWTEEGFLRSGSLNPQKARLLLQLALTRTSDPKEIQRMFDEY